MSEEHRERRESTLTDHDREFINSLVAVQTSEIKHDNRWMKRLSAFALTATGWALVYFAPAAKELHTSIDELKTHMSRLEEESKSIKAYHEIIQKHKWDHMRCHFQNGKGAYRK